MLAHHSITGIWKPSFIPTESAQVLRVLWAARGEAVCAATRASNRLNKYGIGYAGSQSAWPPNFHPCLSSAFMPGLLPFIPHFYSMPPHALCQLKDQAASFVRREEHEHAQLSRQVKNISAFTPDRSPNLGLVRVLERAIKEAKADLKPSDWE